MHVYFEHKNIILEAQAINEMTRENNQKVIRDQGTQ